VPKVITELKIFIASPGDVGEERSRARQILQFMSETYGDARGIHLKVVSWEDVPPSLGDPQTLINRFSEGADLVVVIFARRFGTPTSTFASGTLEEFTRAKERWQQRGTPHLMLFFKDLDRSFVDDPGPQLEQVLRFRRTFENDRTGLFNTYLDVEDFAAKFQRHLLRWLEQVHQPPPKETFRPYLEGFAVVEPDAGMATSPKSPLDEFDHIESRIEYARQAAHGIFTPSSPVLESRLLFGRERYLKWIAQARMTHGKSIVLYGPPASGKTSLLKILQKREHAFYCSASPGHTWALIVRSILEKLKVPTMPEEVQEGVESKRTPGNPFQRVTPDEAAERLSPLGSLVIVDAFDKVRRAERMHFTELIKKLSDRQFSDQQSHLTLLLAGEVKEGEKIESLIPNYRDVKRQVTAIEITPPASSDLERIIDQGFRSLGIRIEADAKLYIIAGSLGFAHLVHQYCLDCVYALEERIRNREKQDLSIGMAECELAETARPTVG
jgi:hypothetical protein